MANEHDSLKEYMPNNEIGLNTSATIQSSLQRGALSFHGRSPVRLEWATAVSEIWISGNWSIQNNISATDYPSLIAYNASTDVRAFELRATAVSSMTFARNVSGTMTNFSTTLNTPAAEYRQLSNNVPFMIHLKNGNPGRVAFYFDNVLTYEEVGDFSTITNMSGVSFRSTGPGIIHRIARLVVADAPIAHHEFETLLPDGAGNSSDWGSGGHTRLSANGNVGLSSGIGMMNPFDPIQVNTTGQKHLSTYANMASLQANQGIYCVQLAAIGAIDSGATPTAISFLARHSSTDYTLDNMGITVGDGYASYQQFLYTNPAGGAWNTTDVNAIQFGVTT
jgi:hypothetical protein